MSASSEANSGVMPLEDQVAIGCAKAVLMHAIQLVHYAPRLKKMLADESHPAWRDPGLDVAPDMVQFALRQRRAQIEKVVELADMLESMASEGMKIIGRLQEEGKAAALAKVDDLFDDKGQNNVL